MSLLCHYCVAILSLPCHYCPTNILLLCHYYPTIPGEAFWPRPEIPDDRVPVGVPGFGLVCCGYGLTSGKRSCLAFEPSGFSMPAAQAAAAAVARFMTAKRLRSS